MATPFPLGVWYRLTPRAVEPTPFKNEGLNKVGRFSRKEIELTAVRFLGSERGRTGRVCKWEVDYKFVGGGFQASALGDADVQRPTDNRCHWWLATSADEAVEPRWL